MRTAGRTVTRESREARLQQIRREAEANHASNGETNTRQEIPATEATGYYGRPVLKQPAWTVEVPLYFFVGGAAGAAAVIAAAGRLGSADEDLIADSQWLAAIGGAISPALLISDLGVPSRFLNMLRVFKIQSPMSVGSWTLVAFSSSAAAAAVFGGLERRWKRRLPVFTSASQIVSALTGLILSTYTGVLVGATVIPAWNENVASLPIHFAASGVGAAASILELRGHSSSGLNRLGIGAAMVETAMGASIELKRTRASEPIRSGRTGWTMRVAGLLAGPLPLTLRLLAGVSRSRRSRGLRRFAAVSSIAGSLMTRFAWVHAGRVSAMDSKVPLQLASIDEGRKAGANPAQSSLPPEGVND